MAQRPGYQTESVCTPWNAERETACVASQGSHVAVYDHASGLNPVPLHKVVICCRWNGVRPDREHSIRLSGRLRGRSTVPQSASIRLRTSFIGQTPLILCNVRLVARMTRSRVQTAIWEHWGCGTRTGFLAFGEAQNRGPASPSSRGVESRVRIITFKVTIPTLDFFHNGHTPGTLVP